MSTFPCLSPTIPVRPRVCRLLFCLGCTRVWSPGAHVLLDLGVKPPAPGCPGRALCLVPPEEGIGEVLEKEDCMQALSGQIFMGMVSSQYQARLDIVRLIDGLVNACIRFVYFSLEDELRSKVGSRRPLCSCCPLPHSLLGPSGHCRLPGAGVCGEDGPGDGLELPHLPHAQR